MERVERGTLRRLALCFELDTIHGLQLYLFFECVAPIIYTSVSTNPIFILFYLCLIHLTSFRFLLSD